MLAYNQKTKDEDEYSTGNTYRWKRAAVIRRFLRVAVTLFLGILVIALSLAVLIGMLTFNAQMAYLLMAVTLLGTAQFSVMFAHGFYIALGRARHSQLTVSAQGIEYRYWSNVGFRAGWADTKRIGNTTGSLHLPSLRKALYLQNVTWFGTSRWVTFLRMFPTMLSSPEHAYYRLKLYSIVHLTGMQGWPKGQLAADLRRYAPHLFK